MGSSGARATVHVPEAPPVAEPGRLVAGTGGPGATFVSFLCAWAVERHGLLHLVRSRRWGPILSAVQHLTSTVGIVALAAAAVAVVSLLVALVMAFRISRLRAEQKAVLGDRREDLVTHAAALQNEFQALREYVEGTAERLDARVERAEGRLDGAISYSSLVRYDAYGEMSGRQSMSIALLDCMHTGIVLSAIHHRDQMRLYAKRVNAGRSELELSPEEAEAVSRALRDAHPATR
jgi:hypothetical protein